MKISPLNKYYFDKSYIVDKHDLKHDNLRPSPPDPLSYYRSLYFTPDPLV